MKINPRKKIGKIPNSWKMNKTLLTNNWMKVDEIKEEIKRFLKTNENEDTSHQALWDTERTALRGKFHNKAVSRKKKKPKSTI